MTEVRHGNTFTIQQIAQVCHEANRAIQHITADPAPSPAWADAPDWQRASAEDGVEKALNGTTHEEQHEVWCERKIADGWVYGPIKDAQKKTHPCLVPYAELPIEQKVKDALFVSIVETLASADANE